MQYYQTADEHSATSIIGAKQRISLFPIHKGLMIHEKYTESVHVFTVKRTLDI